MSTDDLSNQLKAQKRGQSTFFTFFTKGEKLARLARVVVPGLPHHVIQRGIRRTSVFVDAQDRHVHERLLKEKCDQYGVNILSYLADDQSRPSDRDSRSSLSK